MPAATAMMASCVPGRADSLQFAAIEQEEAGVMSGVMRLGRLHLTKDDTDYSGLSFGLTSVTLDGSVAAAGLDLSALCSHSCYLRPLTSGMTRRW